MKKVRIIFINGTYGVGKTSIAYELNKIYYGKSKVIEPDKLWLDSLKKDIFTMLGDGAYPQNNKRFLQSFKNQLDEEIKLYNGLLIVPMTISEDLSYNFIIKSYKSIAKHIILVADDETIKERIHRDKSRDKSLAINSMDNNNKYLDTIVDALFIDTSNLSINEVAKIIINNL